MTSMDFLNKVQKSLDSQEYSLSFSPAKSKNFMLYCNGSFTAWFDCDEMFTDHAVTVCGSLKKGLKAASIEG